MVNAFILLERWKLKELVKSSIWDFQPTSSDFQAPYYGGGGGVGPFPASFRGQYEHYHAIFDQMQKETFKVTKERQAKWRAEVQGQEAVERYGYLPCEVVCGLLQMKVMKVTVHIYLQRNSTWSTSRSS